MNARTVVAALLVVLVTHAAPGDTTFIVTASPELASDTLAGRLVLCAIPVGGQAASSKLPKTTDPADAPFWDDHPPMFALDIAAGQLGPDKGVLIDDSAAASGPAPSKLAPGRYRLGAKLITTRQSSRWRRDPGNLYSTPVTAEIDATVNLPLKIELSKRTEVQTTWPDSPDDSKAPRAELFQIRSTLLSEFHHRDVQLRAGVVFPINYDNTRAYGVVLEVPGFGGDHADALRVVEQRAELADRSKDDAEKHLAQRTFWITLDPESPNGHTLFADSANNGPCARALVEELLPALRAKYKFSAAPGANLLRGHSSGGWSVLWLALNHPDTFGACWSTSPDPVDFRALEGVNIYSDESMYIEPRPADAKPDFTPADRCSYRLSGHCLMTVRQENSGEEMLGADNRSGQQWDSWQAVWGPRSPKGAPAALFEPATGTIDPLIADRYRPFDIGNLTRSHAEKYIPIFRTNIRLICGLQDNFMLNMAVALLKQDVDELAITIPAPPEVTGYIKLVDGDHGTIFRHPDLRKFPQEMLDQLKRAGIPD